MKRIKAKIWIPALGLLAYLLVHYKLTVLAVGTTIILVTAAILLSLGMWLMLPVFASANISDSVAFRPYTLDKNSQECSGKIIDSTPRSEHDSRFHELPGANDSSVLKCSIQSYKNGSVTYDIAFLEFNDAGQLREKDQLTSLLKHITTTKTLTALVFVHGLRNDAAIGSADIRRFHTMTSLTANYVAQRKASSDPNHKTLGIFIGWRGRMLDEGNSQVDNDTDKDSRSFYKQFQDTLAEKAAPITILSRKPQSDEIASDIATSILDIEKTIKAANGDQSDNRLLIYGHSLGGNILIKGLVAEQVNRITQTVADQAPRGIGDLVVLLNPASEAANFSPLQDAVAQTFKTETAQTALEGRAPLWVSLTASRYLSKVASRSNDWDTAVGKYFPMMRTFFTFGQGSREKIMSVGNLLPISETITTTNAKDAGNSKTTTNVVTKTATVGISHEIEIDASANEPTTYAMAGALSSAGPTCPPEDSFMAWQKKVIDLPATSPHKSDPRAGREWNAAVSPKGNNNPDARIKLPRPNTAISAQDENTKTIAVNILHGAARHQCRSSGSSNATQDKCKSYAKLSGWEDPAAKNPNQSSKITIPVICLAWDPIWNAAVHSNVIDEHSGYLSHTMWCVLNRFVLDKPTSLQKPTPQQTLVTSTQQRSQK